MAATILVKELQDAGARLLAELDAVGFPVVAAFWVRVPETGDWRLTLASPTVAQEGPRQAYRLIREILISKPIGLELDHIAMASPQDPLVALLARAVRTPRHARSIAHIRERGVDGRLLPEVIVYRASLSDAESEWETGCEWLGDFLADGQASVPEEARAVRLWVSSLDGTRVVGITCEVTEPNGSRARADARNSPFPTASGDEAVTGQSYVYPTDFSDAPSIPLPDGRYRVSWRHQDEEGEREFAATAFRVQGSDLICE